MAHVVASAVVGGFAGGGDRRGPVGSASDLPRYLTESWVIGRGNFADSIAYPRLPAPLSCAVTDPRPYSVLRGVSEKTGWWGWLTGPETLS